MATQQNGQANSNNSLATADKLFEFVWPFYEVGAEKVNTSTRIITVIGAYKN